MPRYYFHIRDGITAPDEIGTELANWHEAHVEGVRFAGEMIRDHAQRVALDGDWCIEVTDESGMLLFRLDFFSRVAPSLTDGRYISDCGL